MNLPKQIDSKIIKIAGQEITLVILDNGMKLISAEDTEKFNHILELGYKLTEEELKIIDGLRNL